MKIISIIVVLAVVAIVAWHYLAQRKREAPRLWANAESLHDFIARHVDPESGRLSDCTMELPDGVRRFKPGQLRWVAGGMDGALGHHTSGSEADARIERIVGLLRMIAETGSPADQVVLHRLLEEDGVLSLIDPITEQAVAARLSLEPHLHPFIRSLVLDSPDRGPVKFGIGLLGLMQDDRDLEPIVTLGRHEEFTLFTAVAVTRLLKEPEPALWDLAKKVDGWGRIHLVERLAETNNREIRRWLLREGYRNRVMHEYLAYICATSGQLRQALASKVIDAELLDAATELLQALLAGGPARDINDYEDAAVVVDRFLHHVAQAPDRLKSYLVVADIHSHLGEADREVFRESRNGWTAETRDCCLQTASLYLARPSWRQLVTAGLASEDEITFHEASQASQSLDIDPWPAHWRRLQQRPVDPGRWLAVMARFPAGRLDEILDLARKHLPLAAIASGPANELGLGEAYAAHSALDAILQWLDGYPGQGRDLILTGLRSPTIRARNMALRALAAWSPEQRDEEIVAALNRALQEEPEEEVQAKIRSLLGQS